jgi:hypothetical protein
MGYFSTSIKPLNVQSFPVIYSFALLGEYPFSKVINIGSKPETKITTQNSELHAADSDVMFVNI